MDQFVGSAIVHDTSRILSCLHDHSLERSWNVEKWKSQNDNRTSMIKFRTYSHQWRLAFALLRNSYHHGLACSQFLHTRRFPSSVCSALCSLIRSSSKLFFLPVELPVRGEVYHVKAYSLPNSSYERLTLRATASTQIHYAFFHSHNRVARFLCLSRKCLSSQSNDMEMMPENRSVR